MPGADELGLFDRWDGTMPRASREDSLASQCLGIFDRVRKEGDAALRHYTRRWDAADIDTIAVSTSEFSAALDSVDGQTLHALKRAARNIRTFHNQQIEPEDPVLVEQGVACWRELRPIETVGLYVPGGSAVLPSTVLMLGIPAQLAGCSRVVLCVPPRKDGTVVPEVLVACRLVGISEVFRVGGAQAIAAMSVGTESVPRVEKIFGPGNRRVQTAKIVAGFWGTSIDMFAGPSEVLVLADDMASPEFAASDLLAQAEHDPESRAILVSPSASLIADTNSVLSKQIESLQRRKEAEAALEKSFALLTEDLEQAFAFANRYAPEHLILHLRDPRAWTGHITAAGSVFLGAWTPEVAGDYASGTNHTLPTSGLARTLSGVSVDSFVKKITFQQITREGLRRLAPTLETLARVEGLEAHRQAVCRRIAHLEEDTRNATQPPPGGQR